MKFTRLGDADESMAAAKTSGVKVTPTSAA